MDPTCHCANGLIRDEYSGKACFTICKNKFRSNLKMNEERLETFKVYF